MFAFLLIPAALAVMTSTVSAQLLSDHLEHPERNIAYVDSCARFWMPTWDEDLGGFYTNIDRTGQVIVPWGLNKNLLTQTRNAYGLIRAYQLTGETEYLDRAREALDWMLAHCWDPVYGGWYSSIGDDGQPLSPNSTRSAFDAHYALLGPAAYVEATADTVIGAALLQGLAHLEDTFWDDRPGFEGYYDRTNRDNTNPRGKSFNATVDAVTTHLLLQDLMTGEPACRQRLQVLAGQMVDHLVGSMPDQAIGFVEEFDSDWQPDNGETMTIMGHVLKTAWSLGRIHRLDGNPAWLQAANTLFDEVWTLGYDHSYGGPFKDFNRLTGDMLMWSNPDTAKAWWQMEQAVVAGLMLHGLTDDPRPLEMADETLAFFMEHFVDPVYGEIYENRTIRGEETWGTNKGGGGKAGYHSIETGYYAYLYGNLLLHGTPATLGYRFEAAPVDREIRLTPVALAPGELEIAGVRRNGLDWGGWDGPARTLLLPAGIGGEFTVEFRRTATGVAPRDHASRPAGIALDHGRPNPFNPSTLLPFRLAAATPVRLVIHNLAGQRVATLVDGTLPAGEHAAVFDNRAEGAAHARPW
jgi:mannose/cellobiose epimerase-like protein (N-acyl-D-glucosamine 2-epimerase family)